SRRSVHVEYRWSAVGDGALILREGGTKIPRFEEAVDRMGLRALRPAGRQPVARYLFFGRPACRVVDLPGRPGGDLGEPAPVADRSGAGGSTPGLIWAAVTDSPGYAQRWMMAPLEVHRGPHQVRKRSSTGEVSQMKLQGKVALITGAATGIGRATAL